MPSFTLPGDYKVEFTISHKTDADNHVKIWRMTWFATIDNVWEHQTRRTCNENADQRICHLSMCAASESFSTFTKFVESNCNEYTNLPIDLIAEHFAFLFQSKSRQVERRRAHITHTTMQVENCEQRNTDRRQNCRAFYFCSYQLIWSCNEIKSFKFLVSCVNFFSASLRDGERRKSVTTCFSLYFCLHRLNADLSVHGTAHTADKHFHM